MKHRISKLLHACYSLVLVALCVTILVPDAAAQLSDQQKRIYQSGLGFVDYDEFECYLAGTGGIFNTNVNFDFDLGPIDNGEQRRGNLIRALMADFGLSAAQAAGIVGNFMEEAGGRNLPPNINQGEIASAPPKFIGGYGWAQWTGPRQRSFINFAVANGYMVNEDVEATDAANYAYLKYELKSGGYSITITELKKQTSPEDAAVSFHETFEKSADGAQGIQEREAAARQAFQEFTGGGVAENFNGTCASENGVAIVDDYAFPLIVAKSGIENEGMFNAGTASQGGHPYIAYDILVQPGTPVVAFISGRVTRIGQDRCPGRMISIYNEQEDLTVSYLHLSFDSNTHVGLGENVSVGQRIAEIGPPGTGCGIPHLHIDVARGDSRPGCSRLNCPPANRSRFVDIGPQLYETFLQLAE